MGGEGKSFFFQGKDAHFLHMEGFHLFNPFGNSIRDGGHGEDYGG